MRAKPFSRPTLIAAVELLEGHSQARFNQMVLRLGLEKAIRSRRSLQPNSICRVEEPPNHDRKHRYAGSGAQPASARRTAAGDPAVAQGAGRTGMRLGTRHRRGIGLRPAKPPGRPRNSWAPRAARRPRAWPDCPGITPAHPGSDRRCPATSANRSSTLKTRASR